MSHPPRQQERTDAALRKGGKGNSGYQKQGVPNSGKGGGAGPSGGLRNPPPTSRSNKRTSNGPSNNLKGISASEPPVVNSQPAGQGALSNQQRAIPSQRLPISTGDSNQAASVTELGETRGGNTSSTTASLPPTGTAGRGGPVGPTAPYAVGTGPPLGGSGSRTSSVPASSGGPQSSTASLPSSHQSAGGGEVFAKPSGGSSARTAIASATHFQFGSLPMQIPARTNSAPPNLIEQRNEQAQFEAASSAGPSKPPVVVAPQQAASKSSMLASNVSQTANVHSQTTVQSLPDRSQPSQQAHMQLHTPAQGASMPVHVQHPSHAPVQQQMTIPSQQQQTLGQHHLKHQQQMQSGTGQQSLPPQPLGGQMAAPMPPVGPAGKFGQGHVMPSTHGPPPMLANQLTHMPAQMTMPGPYNAPYGHTMAGPTHSSMSGGVGLQPQKNKALCIRDPVTRQEIKLPSSQVQKRENAVAGAGSDGGNFVSGMPNMGAGQPMRSATSGSVPGTSPVLRPPQVAFAQPPMMAPPMPPAFFANMAQGAQPIAGPYYAPGQPKPGVGVPGPPGPTSGSPPVRFYQGPGNGVSGTSLPFMPHAPGPGPNGMKPELAQGGPGAMMHGMAAGVGVNMVAVPVGVAVRPGMQSPAMHSGGVGSPQRPLMPLAIQAPPMMPPGMSPAGMKFGDTELASPTGLPAGFLSADGIGNPSQGMVSHGPGGPMTMMGMQADNRVADMGHRRQMEGFPSGFNNVYRGTQAARPVVNAPQRQGAVGPKPSTPPMGPGNQVSRSLSGSGSTGFGGAGQVGERGKGIEQASRQGGSIPVRDQQGPMGGQGQGGGKKKKEQQRQQQQGLQQRTPGPPHATSQPSVVPPQHGPPVLAQPATDVGPTPATTAEMMLDSPSASAPQPHAAQPPKASGPGSSAPIPTSDRRTVQSAPVLVSGSARHPPQQGLKGPEEVKHAEMQQEGLEKPSEGEDGGKPGAGKGVLGQTIKGGAWGKGPPSSSLPAMESTSAAGTRVPPKGSLSEALSSTATDSSTTGLQPRAPPSGRDGYAGQVREVREQAWETVVGGKAPHVLKHESAGAMQPAVDKAGAVAKETDKNPAAAKQEVASEISAPVASAWAVPGAPSMKVMTAGTVNTPATAKVPGKQAGLKKEEIVATVAGPAARSGATKDAVKQTGTTDGRPADGAETRTISAPMKKAAAAPVAAVREGTEVALAEKEGGLAAVKVEEEKLSSGTVVRDAVNLPAPSVKPTAQGKDGSAVGKEPVAKESGGKASSGKDGGKRGGKGREASHEPKVLPPEKSTVSAEQSPAGAAKDVLVPDVALAKEVKAVVSIGGKGAVVTVKDKGVGAVAVQKDSGARGSVVAKDLGSPAEGKDVVSASTREDLQVKDADPAKVDGGRTEVPVVKEKSSDSFRQSRNVPPKKRPTQEPTTADAKKEVAIPGDKAVAATQAAKSVVKEKTEGEKEGELPLQAVEGDQVPVAIPVKPAPAVASISTSSSEEKQNEGKASSKSKDLKGGGKGKDGKKGGDAGQPGKGDKKSAVESQPAVKETTKVDAKAGTRGPAKADASKPAAKEELVALVPAAAPVAVPSTLAVDTAEAKTTSKAKTTSPVAEITSTSPVAPSVATGNMAAATSSIREEKSPVGEENTTAEGDEDVDAMAGFLDAFAVEVPKETEPRDVVGKGTDVKTDVVEKQKEVSPPGGEGMYIVAEKVEAVESVSDYGAKDEVKQQVVKTASVEDLVSPKGTEKGTQEVVALEEGEGNATVLTAVSPAEPNGEAQIAGISGFKEGEGGENGTVLQSSSEAPATKASAPDSDVSSIPAGGSKKKKMKELLAKADAESKNADLYNAYKAPVEAVKVKEAAPAESAAKEKPAPPLEEAASKEVDDWEDAADMPTPRIGKKGAGSAGGSQGVAHGADRSTEGLAGSQKYTRDFLLTFRDSNTDMPSDFDVRELPVELLHGDAARSLGPGGARSGTPGRVGPPLSMEDDRWTRGAAGRFPDGVLSGQPGGFRPGVGPAGRGGLMGPGGRGMLGAPHMGFPPGPFPPGMGPPGLMGRGGGTNGIDADRWARNPQMARGPAPPPRMNVPGPAIHKLAEEKRFVAGLVTDEEQLKQKKVKGILNKLTPQNFEKLFEQVKEVGIDSASSLSSVISQIFEKALFEPKFCEMYAQFCQKISTEMPEFMENNEKITFKRVLLNKCQEEFERGKSEEADAEREDLSEEAPELSRAAKEEKLNKARQRNLGNIRLIGELYKKAMLTERIMHMCIQSLLGDVNATLHEDQIEALCKLMATIGGIIDHPKAKSHMDSYFQRMENEANNEKLSLRHRFMLRDVIELRASGWQERRKVDGPKKIADVHADAIKERTNAVAAATASIARGDRAGSGGARRGDRGPPPPQMRGGPMGGGFQPGPAGGRGLRGQDVRGESDVLDGGRYAGPARPLQAQRLSDDGDVRLGPQGGLGRGMGVRGVGPGMGPGPGRDSYGMPAPDARRMSMPMSSAQPGHGMMGMGPSDRGPGGGPDHGFMGQDRGPFRGGRGAESPGRRMDEPGAGGRGFLDRPMDRPYTPDRGPRSMPPASGHGPSGSDRGYDRGDSRPLSRDGGRDSLKARSSAEDRPGSSGQGAPGFNLRPATPPQGSGAPPRAPLSEGDCIDKSKSILMDLSRTGDLKEVGLSMEELRAPPEYHSKMVTNWLDQAIQKKDDVRVAFVKLIHHLHQTSALKKEDVFNGFIPFLNDLDDLAVDAPKAPEQVATMLGAFIAAGILPLADVGRSIIEAGPEDAPHALIEGGRGLEMLGHVLARIRQEKGDEEPAALFKASGLSVESFMTEAEKRNGDVLERFLEANCMLDPMIPVQRHLAEALSKDVQQADIVKWLEEHAPGSMLSDPPYYRMVFEVVLKKAFTREQVSSGGGDLKKYATLLKRIVKGKASKHQVQYLFALQHFAHEHEHPSGFLKRTFEDLYHAEVVDEDAYMKWKDDNRDTTSGKVQALKDTAPFFKWLDEAEEEET